jgi:hypothetical protein
MHERALRTVLLVRAIEESDPAGEILPLADREEATRFVLRETRATSPPGSTTLTPHDERLLARRAARLRERLESRSPVVSQLLSLVGGAPHLGKVLLVLAFASGASLAALDGSRRINILAFPLIGLIAWNLLVYVVLIASRLRRGRRPTSGSPLVARFYERWVSWRTNGLLSRSSAFNAPLATAFRRFAADYAPIAHPLLVLRAKRLFHLAAAFVAIGLMAGLYVRGIALRYEAGWESTFLGPEMVGTILRVLYGPASALSGIALPGSVAEVDALRWTGSSGGAEAAPWIHLIAWTALLYIVIPRFLAVLANTVVLWHAARHPAAPPELNRYARLLIGGPAALRTTVVVQPYSYQLSGESIAGLETVLEQALGGPVDIELLPSIAYGDEDVFVPSMEQELQILVFNLAATPEDENHGVILSTMRDRVSKLLVVVDESPVVARMGSDASLDERLRERRDLWRRFVSGYGLRACIADLSRGHVGAAVAQVREALEARR